MVDKTTHRTWQDSNELNWLEKTPGFITWEHDDTVVFPLTPYINKLTLTNPNGSYTIYEDEEPWQ